MSNDLQTLFLRSFNAECDGVISKVKYNNFDASLKRITKSYESVCKLGTIADIKISEKYYQLKVSELRLALEYAMKKEEEKEVIRAAKAEMREAAKVQAEIEEKRKASEKEKKHYMSALKDIDKRIRENPSEKLMKKREEIAAQLKHIKEESAQLDYREANAKAGYVYIISNIGAFGENVYKIGMTRRLEPQDRIDELSSASVPFKFDTHAMIFTKDAPALENALHKAFEANRVNLVNNRKEFYKVPLDRIKAVVRANYDDTVEFYNYADAKDYRESLKIRERMKVKR